MEFFDNPMVDSERLSKLSAAREPDISPLLQTPEYASVHWVCFLLFLEVSLDHPPRVGASGHGA